MRLHPAVAVVVTIIIGVGSVDQPAMAGPRRDLVLVGNVSSITQGGSDLKPWIVSIAVEKVISGDFAGKTFEFTIHSPSRSGLEQGHSYTVRAKWRRDGYEVDENQWRKRSRVQGVVGRPDAALPNRAVQRTGLRPAAERDIVSRTLVELNGLRAPEPLGRCFWDPSDIS